MKQLEIDFHKEMINIYKTAERELSYRATRFIQLVSEKGGLLAAKQLISKENGTEGFMILLENKRLDLSVEALVLRNEYQPLFSIEELNMCYERLKKYEYTNFDVMHVNQPQLPNSNSENENELNNNNSIKERIDEKIIRPNCALIFELKKLKESSKEAIEGIEKFSEFKEYMHIVTKVEEELIRQLKRIYENNQQKSLILVCGSVGDGKSHIISQLRNSHPELLDGFIIHNDATESNDPKKNFKEVIDELLVPFSDEGLESDIPYKLMVAINLGTLSNFIEDVDYKEKYKELRIFVNKNKIIEDVIVPEFEHSLINYVNFSDYSLFDLSVNGPTSFFMKELISNITQNKKTNPFYMNYNKYCLSDCEHSKSCPLKSNYEILSVMNIQESVIQLIIESIIKHKNIVSVRSLLDFVYSILVPIEFEKLVDKSKLSKLNAQLYNGETFWKLLLPNALFEHKGRNSLFDSLYKLDPLNDRVEAIDDFIVEINTLEDKNMIFNSKFNYGEFNVINEMMKALYLIK